MNLSEIDAYLADHSSIEDTVLNELNRETNIKSVYPQMLSGQVQGAFLEMISSLLQARRILEIGTFTGYSAICLARGMAIDGITHTIDNNPELQEIAEKYFKKAGLEEKIELHIGDALEIIPALDEIFDLVFIDAAKEQYIEYYELILPKLKTNGIILADNTLWSGKVLLADDELDMESIMLKRFNDHVQSDERVQNVLLSMRDGVMMIRKK